MRRHLAGLAVLALVLTGCDDASAGTGAPAAGMAGRACQLIEYDRVTAALGVAFDTAGGARKDETYTCVLGLEGSPYPDLTLAMTASTASALIFTATVQPSGAVPVDGLGVTGYQLALPPPTGVDGAASGPGIELGWLSASKRLMFLRYTFPASAAPTEIEALGPKLVALAQQVEQSLSRPI